MTSPMFSYTVQLLPRDDNNIRTIVAPNERRAVEAYVALQFPGKSSQGIVRDPSNQGGLYAPLFNDMTWTWISVYNETEVHVYQPGE